jgi:uncharacterized protein YkwD
LQAVALFSHQTQAGALPGVYGRGISIGDAYNRKKAFMRKTAKKTLKKTLVISLLTAAMLVCESCGKANGALDKEAVSRSKDDHADYHVIDDEAIALAGQTGTSTDAANAAVAAASLVNTQRQAAGLAALVWNDGLTQAAQVRAQECSTSFSHTRPDGNDWWTVNSDIMYGENLAEYYNSADAVVAAWLASPTHKANIMNGGYASTGIAIFQNGNDWYWAQEFGY